MKHFDAAVLGGGPAGITAAVLLSRGGLKTCIVETSLERIGGTCVNEGCMPTKSFIRAAEACEQIRSCGEFGVYSGGLRVDFPEMNRVVKANIDLLSAGSTRQIEKSDAEFIQGLASFKDERTITVKGHEDTEFTADRIVICTGARAVELPSIPFNGKEVVNSTDMLYNDSLPEELVIVGGGAIGCEFANMYCAFGSNVRIVEMADQLLPGEDKEAADILADVFKGRRVRIHTETKITSSRINDGRVTLETDRGTHYSADKVLVAAGRRPDLDALNLEAAGIDSEKGFISVNEKFQTSKPHIYAAGDVIGRNMLAHAAEYEAMVLAKGILGKDIEMDWDKPVPRAVFTTPQVASVGDLSKASEVKEFRFAHNGKAIVTHAREGFVKIGIDGDGIVKSGVIIGRYAAEMIHEITLAIDKGLHVKDVALTIHVHPTFSEAVNGAAR
ncbi:dihydrolipoyl dehydrogenase family protein [Limisalsivibrio acetivorans]|uniref:dihydrolipoyl dehydrogenase family protein n=1 Tax=Limisalsivibrio acetivorans TaxID=1304888 RepID=UPI0003B694F6|nr:NAD(P)/FAD-dependent oxidoreductase [Limisalsivibrio acetivorans]